jgi:hypothetical protein
MRSRPVSGTGCLSTLSAVCAFGVVDVIGLLIAGPNRINTFSVTTIFVVAVAAAIACKRIVGAGLGELKSAGEVMKMSQRELAEWRRLPRATRQRMTAEQVAAWRANLGRQ